jgi:hypothetical protein
MFLVGVVAMVGVVVEDLSVERCGDLLVDGPSFLESNVLGALVLAMLGRNVQSFISSSRMPWIFFSRSLSRSCDRSYMVSFLLVGTVASIFFAAFDAAILDAVPTPCLEVDGLIGVSGDTGPDKVDIDSCLAVVAVVLSVIRVFGDLPTPFSLMTASDEAAQDRRRVDGLASESSIVGDTPSLFDLVELLADLVLTNSW